jgi:hypothetical protein
LQPLFCKTCSVSSARIVITTSTYFINALKPKNMLGHLKPSCALPADAKYIYRLHYCSVCAALRAQNGIFASLFINHELTLVLDALTPYLSGFREKKTACPAAALLKKNPAYHHPAVERAALISYVLAWIKVADWQADKPAFWKKIISETLEKSARRMLKDLPESFSKIIENYIKISKTSNADFETVVKSSAELSQAAFFYVADATELREKDELGDFFYAGALIPVIDHLSDLENDLKTSQYNPIAELAEIRKISLLQSKKHFLQLFDNWSRKINTRSSLLLQKGIVSLNFAKTIENILLTAAAKTGCQTKNCVSCQTEYPSEMHVQSADCYACCDVATCCSGNNCDTACCIGCCTCGFEATRGGCCEICDANCCNNGGDCCGDGCCCGDNHSGMSGTSGKSAFPDFPTSETKDTLGSKVETQVPKSEVLFDTLQKNINDTLEKFNKEFPLPENKLPQTPDGAAETEMT